MVPKDEKRVCGYNVFEMEECQADTNWINCYLQSKKVKKLKCSENVNSNRKMYLM